MVPTPETWSIDRPLRRSTGKRSPKVASDVTKEDSTLKELRKLPFKDLYNIVTNTPYLNRWNKMSAILDYTFPSSEQFDIYDRGNKNFQELAYCAKYSAYAYFMRFFGNPFENIQIIEKKLPFFSLSFFKKYRPGYFLGIDEKSDVDNSIILLCIRGTETMGDCLTDLDATPKPIRVDNYDYKVHPGIYKAAEWIDKVITNKIKDKHQEIVQKGNKCKILVTGHSLGAGVASLLSLIWKSNKTFKDEDFSCYSFASPLVVNGSIKKDYNMSNITSIAVSTDVVTRLSSEGIIEMNQRMKIVQNDNNLDAMNAIIEAKCSSSNLKAFEKKLSEYKDDNVQKVYYRLQKQNIKNIDHNNFLYPCGQILWVLPKFLTKNEKSLTKNINCDGNQYADLLNLIQWQTTYSIIQLLELVLGIVGDFYHCPNNEVLCELKHDYDGAHFTNFVYHGQHSFHAHFPGRYTHPFNVNMYDVIIDMGANIFPRVPQFARDTIIFILVLMLWLFIMFLDLMKRQTFVPIFKFFQLIDKLLFFL